MSKSFEQLKVLAADDNKTNLHIIKVFLNKLGHEVILAENGLIAVDLFVSEKPDIVLMDIMMPVMDGFEAARQIKAFCCEKWVPLIFISAMDRDENLVEGLEAGGDDYLTKPINFVVLEAKIRSMQRSLVLQRQAAESLKRLQTISDAVADVILTVDHQGKIVNCSRAVERSFGWHPKSLVGLSIQTLLPTLVDQAWISDCLKSGQRFETIGQTKANENIDIEVLVNDMSFDDDAYHVLVLRDVTQRKADELQLRANALQLQQYYEHAEAEQQLAMKLMEKQLHRPGLQDPCLHYWVQPSDNFSGDIVAGARSSFGRLYAMLADATGHGLGAAISVLPVLSLFYRMAKLDRSVSEIVRELNEQIKESMPIGRFVALSIVSFDPNDESGQIWMGGTTPAILFDDWGRKLRSFKSNNLPLGILPSDQMSVDVETFVWPKEAQLLLCSDGLIEGENIVGDPFGEERLEQAIAHTPNNQRLTKIRDVFTEHLGELRAQDDVSVLLIDRP